MLVLAAALYICLALRGTHAKIGYFWHITDLHYDPYFSVNGDVRRNCWPGTIGASQRPSGRLGDYHCESPWELVESAVKAMKSKHGDNIEFILWTGDAAAHAGARTPEEQLIVVHNITQLLRHHFSSQFVFPVLGHEDAPMLYRTLADLWRTWLPSESLATFEQGGYYSIEQKANKLRLVMLNTNLFVKAASDDEDPRGQWTWLLNTLAKSQKNKETVYLVGHTPPGVDERGSSHSHHSTAFQERFNKQYLQLVRRYSDIIVGQFFGHLHSDSFRVVYNNDDEPVSWMLIAPSVSPHKPHIGSNNPGLRLYKFDTDTGQVQDYVQYYLDLSTANQREQADWHTEYNLSSYYGMSPVSPAMLHDLVKSFKDRDRQVLFERYYRAHSVRVTSDVACDVACSHTHYCAITRLDYQDYRRCVETASSLTAAQASASRGLVTVGAALPLLAVLMRTLNS